MIEYLVSHTCSPAPIIAYRSAYWQTVHTHCAAFSIGLPCRTCPRNPAVRLPSAACQGKRAKRRQHASGRLRPVAVMSVAATHSLWPNLAWAMGGFMAFCAVVTGFTTGFGGLIRAQVHEGRLYVQWGEDAPDSGPDLQAGAVEVRPTGDARGNGAFAVQNIADGTFLGPYEGELLDDVQYWERYPDGTSDYAICIDHKWTLDARDRVHDTTTFSPCHINHSATRNNVVRKPLREQRAIHFFANRNIKAGEELLLDYGRMYWRGREDQELT